MPLTMQQAKEIWEPHQNRITNVVQRAWQEFKTIQDCRIEHDLSPLLYSRTKSNDIFDAIARNAFEEFGIDDKFQYKKMQTKRICQSLLVISGLGQVLMRIAN